MIYETGEMSLDFKSSSLSTIPKKEGADKRDNYHTISLTSHASILMTRITHRRLESK